MCKKETAEADELVEMFKNMTPEELEKLVEELDEAVNSEKRTSSPKEPKTTKPAQNTTYNSMK